MTAKSLFNNMHTKVHIVLFISQEAEQEISRDYGYYMLFPYAHISGKNKSLIIHLSE